MAGPKSERRFLKKNEKVNFGDNLGKQLTERPLGVIFTKLILIYIISIMICLTTKQSVVKKLRFLISIDQRAELRVTTAFEGSNALNCLTSNNQILITFTKPAFCPGIRPLFDLHE